MLTKIAPRRNPFGEFATPRPTALAAQASRRAPRQRTAAELDGARPLAGMLMVLVVAALMAVADQMIETWADGHLLVVWVALWTTAFMALALVAPPLRHMTNAVALRAAQWMRNQAQRRSNAALWEAAQWDPRVMADIQIATWRSEHDD